MSTNIKTTLIGASTTGKTTIIGRMRYGIFNETTACTIGVSFMKIIYKDTTYDLWDTAGQERYFALLPMYFRGSKILLFVFSVADIGSVDVADTYIKNLDRLLDYALIIIGNKTDLVTETELDIAKTVVREKFSNSRISDHIYGYVFISAKTGSNINVLLDMLDGCTKGIAYDSSEKSSIKLDEIKPDAYATCYC